MFNISYIILAFEHIYRSYIYFYLDCYIYIYCSIMYIFYILFFYFFFRFLVHIKYMGTHFLLIVPIFYFVIISHFALLYFFCRLGETDQIVVSEVFLIEYRCCFNVHVEADGSCMNLVNYTTCG